jgi:hypothetical protein
VRRVRTLEEFDAAVRLFVEQHGRAPTRGSGQEWLCWADWFRYRGKDYRDRIGELGYGHTFDNIKQAMREWIAVHGSHPTEGSSTLWRRRRSWLRKRGSSLTAIARELGEEPTERRFDRSLAELRAAIATYEAEHGHSPPCAKSPWDSWRAWLETHHGAPWSSVATRPRSRHRSCHICSRQELANEAVPQFMLL